MATQRYPADFGENGPSVDYLQMQFIRRDYSASGVKYTEESIGGTNRIFINIPQKVTEAISQQFNQTALGEVGGFLAGKSNAGQAVADSIRRTAENFLLNKSVDLANRLGATSLSAAGLLSASSGVVFNPNLEVLYEGPDFRRFNFQFNLFTKSKQDAEAIYNIVETLRFASLPTTNGQVNRGSLTDVFADTAAVEGTIGVGNALVQAGAGAIQGKLSSASTAGAGALNNFLQNGLGGLLNAAGSGAGALTTASGGIFNSGTRFITQPPFILLTYMRGADKHPFIKPLLPCAIDQISFDFTPTGNYTTVGDFNGKEVATTVGVTITMQLTEVTNLFADKLFSDRAPGVDSGFKPAAGSYQTTAPSGQQYGPMSSDSRLKENIIKVGNSPSGINIYEWNYKSAPNTRYRGVMAQEIMQTHPNAIHLFEDGYMGVHYSHLDVNMEVVK